MADRQPEPEPTDDLFSQFANIDSPFLAWTFLLRDAREEEIASIDRAFRGFGREVSVCNIRNFLLLKHMLCSPGYFLDIHRHGFVE